MCHARDAILVCLDHRIPVLWKRDVSTLGLSALSDDRAENSENQSVFHQRYQKRLRCLFCENLQPN